LLLNNTTVCNLSFENYNKNYGLTHYMWICLQINENMLEYKLVKLYVTLQNLHIKYLFPLILNLLGCSI
jgi:hypothetical protein